MILSSKCKDTAALFDSRQVRKFVNIQAISERKLPLLDAEETLEFLRSPPGNRLEALSGSL
ncbi:plasmid maintenance system killer protein [Herbaspirillum sp. Sphag1AN]|uniref:type II toxin-antitoxin system RelE/ParE family toxin n=1 Tax=unclassified Herbaspirillum TaxID=2624150 RepID=UPI0017F63063|nr:plasmid maintenance system killer protein [Herbaspirillum sp. Sphag1AN]MBB3245011.1 plasmid maintenance system killer protein [Herbaspirillum sp. Sphag64]